MKELEFLPAYFAFIYLRSIAYLILMNGYSFFNRCKREDTNIEYDPYEIHNAALTIEFLKIKNITYNDQKRAFLDEL